MVEHHTQRLKRLNSTTKIYEIIRKISTSQGDDFTTGFLLD